MLQKSSSVEGISNSYTMENRDASQSEACKSDNSTEILLITANVGSLFENPDQLLEPWLKEFFQKVEQMQPLFVALHLQEVGGKTYEKSMESVKEFVHCICKSATMSHFSSIRIYIDEDYNSAQHFTALGNLYFGHDALCSIRIWNFVEHTWIQEDGKKMYTGNIEKIATKDKSKFPQHFFPECKWSRKGFMRTRWELNGTVLDLVNIHLFHDASNLAACESFPSVYCKTRRRALVHTLEKFHMDENNGLVPYFIFGDFNFRCDTKGVIKELTQNLSIHRIESLKNDSAIMHYRNAEGSNILTVGKKEFLYADHQFKFKETWLKKHDRELDVLKHVLGEYEIRFPPSYPYEEDPVKPCDYMPTRCPSWCDRILMSPQASELVIADINNPYNIIGENICMGDHKPVYLKIQLKSNQGTYRCCECSLNVNDKSTSYNNNSAASNFCPYNVPTYNKILTEYMNLNTENRHPYISKEMHNCGNSEYANVSKSQKIGQEPSHNISENSPISINVINSENLLVCWCPQIVKTDSDYLQRVLICPECRNTMKQPVRELLQPNKIIVNQIDSHYLSTVFDMTMNFQDPYTPESLESHSPAPELVNSETGTLESDGFSDIKLCRVSNVSHSLKEDPILNIQQTKKQLRGVVTPGQLKSRLEGLQINNMADTAEGCYVEKNNRKSSVHIKHDSSCLTKCCNID